MRQARSGSAIAYIRNTGREQVTASFASALGHVAPFSSTLAMNHQLMWEMGLRKAALLVFAEHRYEPGSHPALDDGVDCFAYCTTAQALADYVALIAAIRTEFDAKDVPVVAFGGSYGGMLAGWLRIRYPTVVAGSIAASAPVWGLATTLTTEKLDWTSRAISRGVSSFGGSSDVCLSNLRAAWPLIEQIGQTKTGLRLLSGAANTCANLTSAGELTSWAQGPWFTMAEGNYPFASTYITYSVGPGYFPLPPWNMRVACESLAKDFGVVVVGSVEDVQYSLLLGEIKVDVNWDQAHGNGAVLTEAQIQNSGVLSLVAAVSDAVGVWYNVSKDKQCYNTTLFSHDAASSKVDREAHPSSSSPLRSAVNNTCPTCPPCQDCPACPVSHCEQQNASTKCSYKGEIAKTFSWSGVTCNDDLQLYNTEVHGIGNDMFWPPNVKRNTTIEGLVGPHKVRPGCAEQYDALGLRGAPTVSDPWSGWLTSYYGGLNITKHRNIIWSNGALDPWSGAGVYPPGGGPEGPIIQNISADGSQVALVIDLGGHHLDLFFADDNDPPSVVRVRQVEEEMVTRWCQEWYDARVADSTFETIV